MDAGEKRAIRERKRAKMSVFGTTLPPKIVAFRGGAAAAERAEWPRDLRTPKNTPNRSLIVNIINYMSHTSAIDKFAMHNYSMTTHASGSISIADQNPPRSSLLSHGYFKWCLQHRISINRLKYIFPKHYFTYFDFILYGTSQSRSLKDVHSILT